MWHGWHRADKSVQGPSQRDLTSSAGRACGVCRLLCYSSPRVSHVDALSTQKGSFGASLHCPLPHVSVTSAKIVPVPLCQKVSLWNLLTSCLPGLIYFNLYQGLDYLITMCNFTQVHFIYNYIYTSTHRVTAGWGLVEVFLYPFQRRTRMACKRAEKQQKKKSRRQPSGQFIAHKTSPFREKDWRKLCKGKLTEFHVPFGSFPMNIYAGDNIWHSKTK